MNTLLAGKATWSMVSAALLGLVLLVLVGKSAAEETPDRQDAATVQRTFHDALELFESSLSKWSKVQAYSCYLYIRQPNGTESPDKYLWLKVRRDPVLVYAYVVAPARLRGLEHFYDPADDKKKLNVRRLHVQGAIYDQHTYVFRSREIYPESWHVDAMSSVFEKELRSHPEKEHSQIKLFEGAKVDHRLATAIELSFTQQAPGQRFHTAKMFLDDESGMPVHLEAYDWPSGEGEKPSLIESYTYWNVAFIDPKEVEARRF